MIGPFPRYKGLRQTKKSSTKGATAHTDWQAKKNDAHVGLIDDLWFSALALEMSRGIWRFFAKPQTEGTNAMKKKVFWEALKKNQENVKCISGPPPRLEVDQLAKLSGGLIFYCILDF